MEGDRRLAQQNEQVVCEGFGNSAQKYHALTFVCELIAGEDLETKEPITVTLPAQCNVHQLRLQICMRAKETDRLSDPFGMLDPERYRLLYIKDGYQYEIYDSCQMLQTLGVPWSLDAQGQRTTQITISAQLEASEKTQKYHGTLVELIGYDLDAAATNRLDELNYTRRKFVSPRQKELRQRDPRVYATEPWTTSAPIPNDQKLLFSRKLSVAIYYSDASLSLQVDLRQTPCDLKKLIWGSAPNPDQCFERWSEDYFLKVCGREEFLCGDFPLSDFLWVRQCMKNSWELHLSVVAISSLPDDTVEIEDWPLVHNVLGLSSSHEELSSEGKEVEEILTISLWDCDRNFRVKLLGFDIPELPNKIPQTVHVQASIIYGSKVVSSVYSTQKEYTDEVLWNSWLEFDILLRDIPRGAKLGFTINESTQDAATTQNHSSYKSPAGCKVPEFQKGKGKVLFFANLQLIDHRSILCQGPHTLHMWSFPDLEEEGTFTYEADKLSTATNPDIARSMAITFLLDRYGFPIVLPDSCVSDGSFSPPSMSFPSSNLSSPPQSSGGRLSSLGTTGSPMNPFLANDKGLLQRFRQQSVHYMSNLPQFLRTVNWFEPNTVQDVHWLLGQWDHQDLELPVALELLSLDYADERVRKLAVQRLETLSNEEVLRYLLQLVQTLKVEPYHDSFLARFLIQRALRSKRIGHFFFWYLRSEVLGCPFFRQRMGVILEAYLLGCGRSMLSSFQQQVQVITSLHDVATRVKLFYPERSDLPPAAAQKLQGFLQECSLPVDFQVPFDPRIRAGNILLEKCKVMASKKKPLWLEFSCPTSQAPPAPPVGIIFKQGDDLRQDMLVIQTLMVMDSIWQEKSMDLNLVPYGCISTGYNIGMIEIVRDAVTIAAVQRGQGGTRGAFKNDALFEWLKGTCPLQEKRYQAMEKFVNSCAGYCVATYVLGIGDRHNDNIMITNQGNLFHIDFGHILGHTKHFLGMNRERAPFVLTPDFLYVMGRVRGRHSLYFQRFRDTCIKAYMSLRCQSRLLVTLFSVMLLTGIPELSATQDMRYLRTALQKDRPEEEARQHFLQQITECENLGWTVQANWWFHMVVGIK